jgi:hypothetical protein
MAAMLHAFAHLLVHIFVRWYTFLGTSPGGVAAQIAVLVGTEVQGGWWRLEAWRKSWKGGLRRAGIALASVWILAFAVCTVTTVYEDHQGLVAANEALRKENGALKNPTSRGRAGKAEAAHGKDRTWEATRPQHKNTGTMHGCQTPPRVLLHGRVSPLARPDNEVHIEEHGTAVFVQIQSNYGNARGVQVV